MYTVMVEAVDMVVVAMVVRVVEATMVPVVEATVVVVVDMAAAAAVQAHTEGVEAGLEVEADSPMEILEIAFARSISKRQNWCPSRRISTLNIRTYKRDQKQRQKLGGHPSKWSWSAMVSPSRA